MRHLGSPVVQLTFTAEVGGLEVLDGHVLQYSGSGAARVARHDVLLLQPARQPAQMTVAVEGIRQQIPEGVS